MANYTTAKFGIFMATCLLFFLYRYLLQWKNYLRLPPGPKPLPLIGGIMHMPPKGKPEFWHWLKFKDAYGPISSITAMGQTFVVIHDRKMAHDLLEKGSRLSSGRPRAEFSIKLCGFGNSVVYQQNDDSHRIRRKLAHSQIDSKDAVARSAEIRELEVKQLLLSILVHPEALFDHIKNYTGAIVLRTLYGYHIQRDGTDPLMDLNSRHLHSLVAAKSSLYWLVNTFPALGYVPSGFPGTGFKQMAQQYKRTRQAAFHVPYEFVQRQMASCDNEASVTSNLISQCNEADSKTRSYYEGEIKALVAALAAGGINTTISTLTSFFLAMVKFPDVQRKAQEEINRVISSDRLPGHQDRPKLPYTEAIVKELYRWFPTVPMGVDHRMTEDTIFHGHFIPKDATILPAVWWFTHDPAVYAHPDIFDPDRYLEPRNEPDPRSDVFGYGKRKCLGRGFADNNIFLVVAQVLAGFRIMEQGNDRRKEAMLYIKAMPSVIVELEKFPYRISARSAAYEKLIRDGEAEQPVGNGDADCIRAILASYQG